MTRLNRRKLVSLVAVFGIAVLGTSGAAFAQDATPVASPVGGPPMELPPPPAYAEVVATGLANPRGIAIGADGAVYVAEAGVGGDGPCAMGPEGNEECFGLSGGVTRIAAGTQERIIDGLASRAAEGGMNATGPNDVGVVGDTVYVLIGLGGDPATRVDVNAGANQFGYLFKQENGELTTVADIAGYETKANPDGNALDANPFGLVVWEDGSALVTDAGMNALLAVGGDGAISTWGVFPNETAKAPDGSEIPMNAVPTGVVQALDGAALVGQLTGFPFPVGGAKVFMVPSGGGDPTVIQEGFTNIIDLALGPDGSLYVLELVAGGLLNADPTNPATLDGQLTRILPDGTREVVAKEGLSTPTGLAVDADGNIYVAVFGVLGNMGQVWKIAAAS
ncbi:MAG: ScyD/ScyE family protein [Thermomicrobiales bacterium]